MGRTNRVVILGVFVADTAYRADRAPRMGETILGNSFKLGPGGKGSNQAVAFACADLAVLYESARLLTYQAAALRDAGRPFTRAAAIAKLQSTEAAVTATRMATQVFGGYGFMDETLVARQYRDAKILEIGEGTSEIQRLVIARDLGLHVT